MSEDQRPARVRVVNNGMAPATSPQRRRNDPAMLAAAAARAQPRGRNITAIGAVLFLAACAIGGALFTASGLTGELGL
jgi:hypothetical protein